MSKFDRCFEILLGHEGGYVNHPADPGGETRYGITKRTYPAENIRELTVERAKELYRRDFWDKVRGDDLPGPVALLVWDGAVNSGVAQSVVWLQTAVGATPDGVIGPRTVEAVHRKVAAGQGADILVEMLTQRLLFMAGLRVWSVFRKGWARRLFGVAFQAARMDP